MILHIYHCNMVIARDKRKATGRNRPSEIARVPRSPGERDIVYEPPRSGFDDDLGELLDQFRHVDLAQEDGPLAVNWAFLQRQLGADRESVKARVARARALGLLPGMAIDYDHEAWMAASRNKGCLLVMMCVEDRDLRRERRELLDAFGGVVMRICDGIVGGGEWLERVYIMPNVHLGPRAELATDAGRTVALMEAAAGELRARDLSCELNSFGYSKMLQLAINAHPMGYVLRVI